MKKTIVVMALLLMLAGPVFAKGSIAPIISWGRFNQLM